MGAKNWVINRSTPNWIVSAKINEKPVRIGDGFGMAVAILTLLFGMAAAWKWTPLADQIDVGEITAWALFCVISRRAL
jgi:hypothetical protein